MNDFTKEELEELHCVWFNMLSARDATPFEEVLLRKLEAMIDNYPEICGLCNRTNCQECPCR